MPLISIITHQSPEYDALKELRDAVLRRPLGLSIHNDDLSKDASAIILIATESDALIGCILLQPQEEKSVLRLRAMAVAETHRGSGTGRQLVEAAEAEAIKNGATKIMLHARQVVVPFYEKLGYATTGAPFSEVGIPHVLMQKHLSA